MSGVKVTNERPAKPIPDIESVVGDVDGENVDWEPDSTTGIPPGNDPGDVLTWDGDSWEPEPGSGSPVTVTDEGSPLTSALASLDFVGAGVAATAIGDAVTVTIPGGSGSLPWFIVTDYGAVGDNSTDDTTAIQDAIDAAEAAGGGVVYFPLLPYVIGGALQDTGRSNAQLLLPRVNLSGTPITIHLLGEAAPPAIPFISGASVEPTNGPMLRSTLSSGTGAVIGAWGPSGSFADFTLLRAVIENLEVRTVADPTNSAIDLSHVEAVELRNVLVDAGEFTMTSISSQTTATSYGIKLPNNNNGASTVLDAAVNVVGFYNGIAVGEHTVNVGTTAVWAARQAYVFDFAYHSADLGRLGMYHCNHGLVFLDHHYLVIEELNIEHAAGGTWVVVHDLDDSLNVGHGHVAWHTVLESTGVVSSFVRSGGSTIYDLEIGSDPFGGSGAPTTLDYLVGTATGSLSAEIVVGTSPGGELGGTWASPTVDSTHSGSAHTDFVAKSVGTTKGDLLAFTASAAVARVGVGTDGQYLKADSGASTGVSWAPVTATVTTHDESLTDGASNFIFAGGDIVTVVGVPNP